MKKVSGQASIRHIPGCPVKILNCSVFYDKPSGTQFLEVELENNSGKVIAAVNLYVVCYDARGREVSRQEQTFYTHENLCKGRYEVRKDAGRGIALSGRAERVSVSIQRVIAFQKGDSGEVEDITYLP